MPAKAEVPQYTTVLPNGSVTIAAGEKSETLVPGTYRKVTNRVGNAHLTVSKDGGLSYTNRRGDAGTVEPKEFLRIFASGLNTLHDGTKPEKPAKTAKAAKTEAEAELATV